MKNTGPSHLTRSYYNHNNIISQTTTTTTAAISGVDRPLQTLILHSPRTLPTLSYIRLLDRIVLSADINFVKYCADACRADGTSYDLKSVRGQAPSPLPSFQQIYRRTIMLTTDTAAPPFDQGYSNNPYNSRNKFFNDRSYDPSVPVDSSRAASGVPNDPNSRYYDYESAYSAAAASSSLMNGIVGPAQPGAMYVRALYDYEADDRTSLSFHEGDVIQVINRLDSGWWDGVINGVRGWFPSNYCQVITSPDELPDTVLHAAAADHADDELVEEGEAYEEEFEDDESDPDGVDGLPLEGIESEDRSRSDFWIPQATPDGRLFYYNMMTGDRTTELPLESPSSSADAGPRDRSGTNVSMPDETRPPPEMMARGGLTRDEEQDSEANSASEIEGENILAGPRGALVCFAHSRLLLTPHPLSFSSLSVPFIKTSEKEEINYEIPCGHR